MVAVRSPVPGHAVDMTDGRCELIDAETPRDEGMTLANVLSYTMMGQRQMIDEVVGCSME